MRGALASTSRGVALQVPRCGSSHGRWLAPEQYCSTVTEHRHRARSAPEGTDMQEADESLLLRDIERFKQREQAQELRSASSSLRAEELSTSAGGGLKDALDKVLIADFFFVCAALAWLVAGVGVNAALNNSALLDAWYPLWQWVFQPAIGVLMLGAMLSGAVAWLARRDGQ